MRHSMARSILAIASAAPFGPCSMSVLTLEKCCARNERDALVFGVRLKTMFRSSWSAEDSLTADSILKSIADSVLLQLKWFERSWTARIVLTRTNAQRRW